MGRIILADDDEIVAELVSDALIAAGHAVGWLSDGRSALEVIRRRPPDLVILDCMMPEMSGIMVLREMRSSRYEGANDYLSKPFDPVVLVGRAEALMRGERRWD
jgi:DNA-binding response OmpR family regulator